MRCERSEPLEDAQLNKESSNKVPASAAGSTSPQPKSDLSDFGQSKVPNSGKPEFGWGEVDAQSASGEGEQDYREARTPSPHPSPLRGEGAGRAVYPARATSDSTRG